MRARASLLEDANVAATALSQGSMAGFTGEQRGQVDKFLVDLLDLGEILANRLGRLRAVRRSRIIRARVDLDRSA